MADKKSKAPQARQMASPTVVTSTEDRSLMPVPKWALWAVLAFTALLYSGALSNGFTFIDDDYYILKNPYLQDFSWKGIWAICTSFNNYNYHPLTTLADLFIYKWFGLEPMPYHLLNVLLHVVNVWLVFVLAERLSGKRITALVVAILFAVHPLHVESVAWVSELKDVLYSSFYLTGIIVYLRYLDSRSGKDYLIILALFLASLLSKSAAVTFPLLLIVIDVYKDKKITASSLALKIPFCIFSLVFGILAIKSQSSGGAVNDVSIYYSFINRIFLFTSGIAFYFINLIAPFNLSALHFYPDITGSILPWYYYLSLPFLLLLVWLVARKNAYRKEAVFGIAFFLVTISVMLQIITVGASFAAERYTYIPYIALFYIAGQWIADNYGLRRKVLVPVFSVIAILFSVLTWLRIDKWKDTDTLFTDIVEKNAGNWRTGMVYNSWGDYERYIGDNSAAIQKYTEAVRLYPSYNVSFYNRGKTYEEARNFPAALADYTEAIKLSPKTARYYNARGWVNYQSDNKGAAMDDFNMAIAKDPTLPEAYNNRGWAYYKAASLPQAMSDFDTAIAHAPTFSQPYYNRATIEVERGDLAGATKDYNTLISINPSDSVAYFNRGIMRMNQGNMQGACADWNRSLELGYKDAAGMLQHYCR